MKRKATIGREWREWREKHKFSQAQLAFTLGIALRTVKYIESATVRPSQSTAEKFRNLVEKHREAKRNTCPTCSSW